MEDYIIRIQSIVEGKPAYFGTGIVVGSHEVLTARHVVSGESHVLLTEDGNIPLSVQNETDAVVLLYADLQLPFGSAEIFSVHEGLDTQSAWTSDGYITPEQIPHTVAGHGIAKQESTPGDWDHTLSNIESGHAENYKGLSGAPVFSRNRIAGILQVQETNSSGALGLRMLSVEAFLELVPPSSLRRNEYEELVDEKSTAFSSKHVEENKRSRKYIPDIFVENGPYKERLRYFVDPVLFLKKLFANVTGWILAGSIGLLHLMDCP